MKVPRSYVGKVVEIVWCDPTSDRCQIETLKKGRSALATWTEYGVIYDVTDNIVLIAHSLAAEPGKKPSDYDELVRTSVHEDLIEKITVYEPVKEGV